MSRVLDMRILFEAANRHLSDVLLLSPELRLIVVVDLFEGLAAIHKVAGVDADLLKGISHRHSHGWLEVDVGHQRRVVPAPGRSAVSPFECFTTDVPWCVVTANC